ncbi:hypothetical protein L6R53_03535 [Myxococcota bacterium]|nr:hypothetical protein [Myxococcota bacterium]
MNDLREHLADAAERLRRALDRARLYGVAHREAKAAIEHAWQPLREILSLGRPLTLQAGPDGLSWQGGLLAAEDEDKEGLGRILHREGIAELTLRPDLHIDELVRLLDVVRINLALPEHEEETLESLLWQARLEGVTFRAVAALMEAEAISGDALRYVQARGPVRTSPLVAELDAASRRAPRRGALADDDLVRAVATAEDPVPMIAGEDGAWDVEAEALEAQLLDEADPDARAAARLRAELALEQPGDQLRRACLLLFRAAASAPTELGPDQALPLARDAIDEVLRQHDAFALSQLVHTLRQELGAATDPEATSLLREVLARATQPVLVARLLAAAGPTADPAATEDLVALLDDNAIRALVEWSFQAEADGEAGRGRWLATALGEVAARRARRWLWDEGTEPELLVPAALLLRGRDGEDERALRPTLLDHPAGRVVEITLEWYAATGVPAAERPAVLALLEDRRPRIRAAARATLVRWPPPDIAAWFQARLSQASLAQRPPDLQRDLCVACGQIMGPKALRPLQALLDRRVGMFAGKGEGELLEAAAFGLAAIGGPEARAVLEEGAKSWVGARSAACKAALARLHGGRS